MSRWDKKTTVEDCHGLWASSFHQWGVFKPSVGHASGTVQWKNGLGEVIASVGYSFSQQPPPRLTLSYTLTR
ncbi:MAG: hypothetical protein HYZ73_04770, partial [Elusimicrobia bacterium]|nr:hypothetical protein [Elusimicrobiota bacterium]